MARDYREECYEFVKWAPSVPAFQGIRSAEEGYISWKELHSIFVSVIDDAVKEVFGKVDGEDDEDLQDQLKEAREFQNENIYAG